MSTMHVSPVSNTLCRGDQVLTPLNEMQRRLPRTAHLAGVCVSGRCEGAMGHIWRELY